MSTVIPDVSAAEGIVVHWLRTVFFTSPSGSRDSVYLAAGDAIRDELTDDEFAPNAKFAFALGAEFGVRVALAVVASPLGGFDDVIKGAAGKAVGDLARYSLDTKADEIAGRAAPPKSAGRKG